MTADIICAGLFLIIDLAALVVILTRGYREDTDE